MLSAASTTGRLLILKEEGAVAVVKQGVAIRRIAKRSKPVTLHAMTWISLEPGVVVRDIPMLKANMGGAWSSKSIMCVCTDNHRFRCHVISQTRCSDLLRAE